MVDSCFHIPGITKIDIKIITFISKTNLKQHYEDHLILYLRFPLPFTL
jgi:hypothetical protein